MLLYLSICITSVHNTTNKTSKKDNVIHNNHQPYESFTTITQLQYRYICNASSLLLKCMWYQIWTLELCYWFIHSLMVPLWQDSSLVPSSEPVTRPWAKVYHHQTRHQSPLLNHQLLSRLKFVHMSLLWGISTLQLPNALNRVSIGVTKFTLHAK